MSRLQRITGHTTIYLFGYRFKHTKENSIITASKSSGIFLKVIPYLDQGRIFKIFTPEEGLITLMAKKSIFTSMSPFCIGEWIYRKGTKEIGTLIDASIEDPLLRTRQSYSVLTACGTIAQDLLHSQLPGNHAPHLYQLLCSYFKKISDFINPDILVDSFRLKLLIHEGLLSIQNQCTSCNQLAYSIAQGSSVCKTHANPFALEFSPSEWSSLQCLAYGRHFSLLQQADWHCALSAKIKTLFKHLNFESSAHVHDYL